MFLEYEQVVKINATHSHTKTTLAEIRFYKNQKLFEVKAVLSKKFGTLPEYMKLKLIGPNGSELPLSNFDEEKSLKELGIQDYDTLHVIDLNPNSVLVQNNLDDLSTVKKYEISEEDYMKREDNIRKFKKKLLSDPNYIKMLEETQGPTYEAEASEIEINSRCLLGDGVRRGEVVFVGLVPELGYGFFVGVKLDEPMGESNGTVKGKKYFECESKYGTFVRPDYVKCGDFPPEDIFNAEEDEI
jgi:tubulin-folding cofactor B